MDFYNIGQYRYSKSENYFSSTTSKKIALNDQTYVDAEGGNFKNVDLAYEAPFIGLHTYYFKCELRGLGEGIAQNFTIKLKDDSGEREQIVKHYSLSSQGQDRSTVIELVFTPKTYFSKLVFILDRKTTSDFDRKMSFSPAKEVTLSEVKDIFETSSFGNIDSIFKIGIQGDPDLIVCINGEPIRLGRSGMFEIHEDDFSIYSIGFIPPTSNDSYFIMDYCY